ncbi:MAG: Fimbrial protein [Luteibacter sp.]|uniref:pilin n=1 Tax=Luteibacter sp. TaxID=1886636 RepID=UPI0013823B37|nr:pilin [Luteibacter sp.]KAF1006440.1 MAG: Fimbrial protein [Luteibacter sp.]
MTARRTVLLSAAIVAALGLAACHKGGDETPTADPKAIAAAQAAISSPAWLRQHLPAQTVSYVRIPSPWTMIGGTPNGRPLDAALSAKAHLDVVATLRESIAKDKALADLKIASVLSLLLDDLRSPVEVALIDPLGIPSPTSRIVVTAVLGYPSVDAFNARLASLSTTSPILTGPLDAKGNGTLTSGGVVRYDVAIHRLWATQAVKDPSDAAKLDALIADIDKATADSAPASLKTLESRIHTSGQGLFGWLTVRGIGGVAAAQAGDNPLGRLPADFATKADAIAFGAGTVDGQGQFRFITHAPQARILQYLAPTSFAPTIKTAGEPRWALTFALPGPDAFKHFEDNLNLDFGPDAAAKYRELDNKLKQRFDASFADYPRWFGPELVVFADDAGTYYALRTRDMKVWRDHLTSLASRGWKTGTTQVDGAEVHWVSSPPQGTEFLPKDEPSMKPLADLIGRMGGKSWWIEDGDWIVMAKVPQALSDRVAAKPDTSLADWLSHRHYPGDRTLIGFTATSHGAQRDAYYTYIQILQVLAAASGSDADIATLPSAHTLGLPDKGVLGAAIETDQDTLALSFTYQETPFELLGQSGSGSMVGTAAILAAIAIPQYQNYIIRAQVASALEAAAPVKAAVASKRLATGRFPANNAAAGLGKPDTLGNDYAGSVAIGQGGAIEITLDATPPHKTNAKLDSGQLILTPRVEKDRVDWDCEAEGIEKQYLPALCRGPAIEP